MLNSKNKNILPRSRPLTFQLTVFPNYLYYFSYFPWLDNNKKGTQKKEQSDWAQTNERKINPI